MARSAVTVSKCLLYNTAYAVTADACDLDDDHEIDAKEMAHDRLLVRFLGATTKYTATMRGLTVYFKMFYTLVKCQIRRTKKII